MTPEEKQKRKEESKKLKAYLKGRPPKTAGKSLLEYESGGLYRMTKEGIRKVN